MKIAELQEQLQKERRRVSFDAYDLSVRQILDMLEEGQIFVPPEYQRQFVWDTGRESGLIESVFLGIPVPSLFLATNADATWEVVDGVQRMSTLAHFVGTPGLLIKCGRNEPLKIVGLEKLEALNGHTFAEIPKSLQVSFTTRPLKLTVLNDLSDLNVRFDLFQRLNTGGVALTEQEIRNCVLRGAFNDQLKELAEDPNFIKTIRMNRPQGGTFEELVLRFFAYLDRYQQFDHLVTEFLNRYMESHRNSKLSADKKSLFQKTFAFLAQALPDGIVRKGRTPVNLFEAMAVGVALSFQEGNVPIAAKAIALLTDEKLRKLTGAGSNQKSIVRGRIEHVRDNVA